jgi:hypothetical protein
MRHQDRRVAGPCRGLGLMRMALAVTMGGVDVRREPRRRSWRTRSSTPPSPACRSYSPLPDPATQPRTDHRVSPVPSLGQAQRGEFLIRLVDPDQRPSQLEWERMCHVHPARGGPRLRGRRPRPLRRRAVTDGRPAAVSSAPRRWRGRVQCGRGHVHRPGPRRRRPDAQSVRVLKARPASGLLARGRGQAVGRRRTDSPPPVSLAGHAGWTRGPTRRPSLDYFTIMLYTFV